MHREELEQLDVCASCQASIIPNEEESFAFGPNSVLCWKCAIDRGGVYNEYEERWTTAPNVSDLRSPFEDQ